MLKLSWKRIFPYVIVAFSYYLLPQFLVRDTGSGMSILLFVIPLIVLGVSIRYSMNNRFWWIHSVLVGFLWIPNIFLLNDSASVYIVVYGVISLLGQAFGVLFDKGNFDRDRR